MAEDKIYTCGLKLLRGILATVLWRTDSLTFSKEFVKGARMKKEKVLLLDTKKSPTLFIENATAKNHPDSTDRPCAMSIPIPKDLSVLKQIWENDL